MLKHSIIVHKPVLPASTPTPPWRGVHGVGNGRREITNQYQYDGYMLGRSLYKIGTVLSMMKDRVTTLLQCHIIIEINTDYDSVTWQPHTGKPKSFHLLQLGSEWQPWKRWDDIEDYRMLTEEEFNTFVAANLDKISNYCKQHSGRSIIQSEANT